MTNTLGFVCECDRVCVCVCVFGGGGGRGAGPYGGVCVSQISFSPLKYSFFTFPLWLTRRCNFASSLPA